MSGIIKVLSDIYARCCIILKIKCVICFVLVESVENINQCTDYNNSSSVLLDCLVVMQDGRVLLAVNFVQRFNVVECYVISHARSPASLLR